MDSATRTSNKQSPNIFVVHGRGLSNGVLGLIRGVIHWAPIWLPLGFLALVALRGLQPAIWESQRLDTAESTVFPRHRGEESSFLGMQAEVEAWGDSVYRERQRRKREGEKSNQLIVSPAVQDSATVRQGPGGEPRQALTPRAGGEGVQTPAARRGWLTPRRNRPENRTQKGNQTPHRVR